MRPNPCRSQPSWSPSRSRARPSTRRSGSYGRWWQLPSRSTFRTGPSTSSGPGVPRDGARRHSTSRPWPASSPQGRAPSSASTATDALLRPPEPSTCSTCWGSTSMSRPLRWPSRWPHTAWDSPLRAPSTRPCASPGRFGRASEFPPSSTCSARSRIRVASGDRSSAVPTTPSAIAWWRSSGPPTRCTPGSSPATMPSTRSP